MFQHFVTQLWILVQHFLLWVYSISCFKKLWLSLESNFNSNFLRKKLFIEKLSALILKRKKRWRSLQRGRDESRRFRTAILMWISCLRDIRAISLMIARSTRLWALEQARQLFPPLRRLTFSSLWPSNLSHPPLWCPNYSAKTYSLSIWSRSLSMTWPTWLRTICSNRWSRQFR